MVCHHSRVSLYKQEYTHTHTQTRVRMYYTYKYTTHSLNAHFFCKVQHTLQSNQHFTYVISLNYLGDLSLQKGRAPFLQHYNLTRRGEV